MVNAPNGVAGAGGAAGAAATDAVAGAAAAGAGDESTEVHRGAQSRCAPPVLVMPLWRSSLNVRERGDINSQHVNDHIGCFTYLRYIDGYF